MHCPRRPRSLLALALAGLCPTESPASNTQDYAIPPGSLGTALNRLAAVDGWQIVYDATLAEHRRSPGVSGRHTREEALDLLLAEAPLRARVVGDNTVALEPAAKSTGPQAAGTEQQADGAPVSLDTVVVTDQYNSRVLTEEQQRTRYAIPNASSATRTDTPLIDTPISIQVVPQAVIRDQQATSLSDIVKNVSGVQWSPVVGELYEDFVVRGFQTNGSTYRNGVRDDSFSTDNSNLERLEVLKGPVAVMYGRIEPGGMLNRVTKQALWQPYYSLEQQFGSFNFYRTSAEAGGTVPGNDDLAYRFNVAYKNNQSFRDFIYNQRVFVAPVMNWQISDQTEVGIGFEYQNDNLRWDDGIPVVGNRPTNLPNSRYLSDPISNDTIEREVVDFHWSHRFNDAWKVNHRFSTFLANYSYNNIIPMSLESDNQTLLRGAYSQYQSRNTYSTNINLTGDIDAYDTHHTLLFGFDFYRFDQTGQSRCCAEVASQDIYAPTYGTVDEAVFTQGPKSYGVNQQTWYGLYFQDQIKLWDDQIHILGGGRYDWTDSGTIFGTPTQAEAWSQLGQSEIHVEKFSPRVGLVYKPLSWLSAYANYTEGLMANNGRTADNLTLKPQQGYQYEGGFKGEWFDGRVISTLAFYNVVKQNIAVPSPDPVLALQGVMVPIGEARSRGIEFDVTGSITENWSVIANYAYTDARITHDTTGTEGNRLPLAPLNSASLWTKYAFIGGDLDGLSLATGVRVVGMRQGDVQNDFQLPGYATWDMAAAYAVKLGDKKLTAQLNVNNILDKRYFSGSDLIDGVPRLNVMFGAPVNFMGSLRLEF